jgi:hypothetical protein
LFGGNKYRDRLLVIFYVNKNMVSLLESEYDDLSHLLVEFKKIVAEVNKPFPNLTAESMVIDVGQQRIKGKIYKLFQLFSNPA